MCIQKLASMLQANSCIEKKNSKFKSNRIMHEWPFSAVSLLPETSFTPPHVLLRNFYHTVICLLLTYWFLYLPCRNASNKFLPLVKLFNTAPPSYSSSVVQLLTHSIIFHKLLTSFKQDPKKINKLFWCFSNWRICKTFYPTDEERANLRQKSNECCSSTGSKNETDKFRIVWLRQLMFNIHTTYILCNK